MNEFIDRKTQFPNRKILEVMRVDRDEAGEPKTMLVEEIRDEGKVEVEGTPLNAETLNQILSALKEDYKKEAKKILADYDVYREEVKTVKLVAEQLSLNNEVSGDFLLPEWNEEGGSITWSSSDPIAISIEGNKAKVKKEIVVVSVILTATLTYKRAITTKDFEVYVESRDSTDEEKVNYDKNLLNIPSVVTTDFEIPLQGFLGSSIRWTSDNDAIEIKGNIARINRPPLNVSVTLKAELTYGSQTTTKEFKTNVMGLIGYSSKPLSCSWIQEDNVLKTEIYTITSNTNQLLYIEIEEDNTYLSSEVIENASKTVSFKLLETSNANTSSGTGAVTIPYKVKIYSYSTEKKNFSLLCTVPGEVIYYYKSTTPID